MSGHKFTLPKNTKVKKDGTIVIPKTYHNASQAIASKKSPKQKCVRRIV